jgi:hypothetical protein
MNFYFKSSSDKIIISNNYEYLLEILYEICNKIQDNNNVIFEFGGFEQGLWNISKNIDLLTIIEDLPKLYQYLLNPNSNDFFVLSFYEQGIEKNIRFQHFNKGKVAITLFYLTDTQMKNCLGKEELELVILTKMIKNFIYNFNLMVYNLFPEIYNTDIFIKEWLNTLPSELIIHSQ